MKIYFHPISTTSRMVWLGAEEMGIDAEYEVVDLTSGVHLRPPYSLLNPSCMVPMIEDGEFRLTESSAILKYLGEVSDSPAYAGDIRRRARINEMMDWFNANLSKDLAYGLVYPQLFPNHQRPSEALQTGTLEWGKKRAQHWLSILDQSLLADGRAFLCGDTPTIADYLAGPMVTLGDLVRCDWRPWPRLGAWLDRIRGLDSWAKVNEVFNGFSASLEGRTFVHL